MLKSDLGAFHDGFGVVRGAGREQEAERERGALPETGAAGLRNPKHPS
jgi:hypothetical protein